MPSLMPLLDNPFLLNLVLQVLPTLLKGSAQPQKVDITRADIYEEFTKLWFAKESYRGRQTTQGEEQVDTNACQKFAEQLAFEMRKAKTLSVTSGGETEEAKTPIGNWFDTYTPLAARHACPLQRTGLEYGYIHKSLYEYFLASSLLSDDAESTKMRQERTPISDIFKDEPSVLRFTTEFRESPKRHRQQKVHQLFLNLVGYGEQDEAERMLQAQPNLACQHGDLTDCSGRTFTNITAFQYAVWALDFQMWRMIKQHMEKHNLKESMRAQMEELNDIVSLNEQQGWLIKPGKSINWPSIGWTSLIKALDEYVKNYDAWNGTQCTNHWRQQVGGAQLILPAHVINEYSHPSRPFYPCPQWEDTEASLPRTGVSDWINNSGNKLGKEFAWCRGEWRERLRITGNGDIYYDYARYDLAAVSKLLTSRTAQARVLLETNY